MNRSIKLFAESEYFIQDSMVTTCFSLSYMFFKFLKIIKVLNKNLRKPYK